MRPIILQVGDTDFDFDKPVIIEFDKAMIFG